jgi:hypothetical protein
LRNLMAMTEIVPPLPELDEPASAERLDDLRQQFAKMSERSIHPVDEALRIVYGAAVFVAIVLGARFVVGSFF